MFAHADQASPKKTLCLRAFVVPFFSEPFTTPACQGVTGLIRLAIKPTTTPLIGYPELRFSSLPKPRRAIDKTHQILRHFILSEKKRTSSVNLLSHFVDRAGIGQTQFVANI